MGKGACSIIYTIFLDVKSACYEFFIIFAHCRLYAEDVQTRTVAATGVP